MMSALKKMHLAFGSTVVGLLSRIPCFWYLCEASCCGVVRPMLFDCCILVGCWEGGAVFVVVVLLCCNM